VCLPFLYSTLFTASKGSSLSMQHVYMPCADTWAAIFKLTVAFINPCFQTPPPPPPPSCTAPVIRVSPLQHFRAWLFQPCTPGRYSPVRTGDVLSVFFIQPLLVFFPFIWSAPCLPPGEPAFGQPQCRRSPVPAGWLSAGRPPPGTPRLSTPPAPQQRSCAGQRWPGLSDFRSPGPDPTRRNNQISDVCRYPAQRGKGCQDFCGQTLPRPGTDDKSQVVLFAA